MSGLRDLHYEEDGRFWMSVFKTKTCWIWTGTRRTNKSTYGQFKVRDKKIMAHRWSWEIHFGSIPEGMFVLHKCDNPPCVRPSHLFLGTKGDNNRDRNSKGRTISVRKFTDHQISRMREEISQGATIKDTAEKYGIDRGYLSRVARGLLR